MNSSGHKTLIEIKDLSLSFGGTQALADVAFDVRAHEILAIIGPNGAGKTCLFNCINSFYRPEHGRILYQGKNLVNVPPHKIPKMGIARTFQNMELFTGLTTLENLLAARHRYPKLDTALMNVDEGIRYERLVTVLTRCESAKTQTSSDPLTSLTAMRDTPPQASPMKLVLLPKGGL